MKTVLLLIDPQNDFCIPSGALYVPGAEQDCKRLVEFMQKNTDSFDDIAITLDCHPYYHIAHPVFWKGKDGKNPAPYTVITYEDIQNGTWLPVDKSLIKYVTDYILELKVKARYKLTIWNPHCLYASTGFCIEENILNAVREWETKKEGKSVCFFPKTNSPFTEHYSSVHAEVPVPDDDTTKTNFAFIDMLKNADSIIVAGQALSHCVCNTLKDLQAYVPLNKMILLTDCTSNIAGYENSSERFLKDFEENGMKLQKSTRLMM